MEAHVTLQWFVHPQWFQELGAFANEENIPIFVDWCETAFKLFGEVLLGATACMNLVLQNPDIMHLQLRSMGPSCMYSFHIKQLFSCWLQGSEASSGRHLMSLE